LFGIDLGATANQPFVVAAENNRKEPRGTDAAAGSNVSHGFCACAFVHSLFGMETRKHL